MSRVLAPFVARVIIANPLQVKAIAQAHVKTDKIDAGALASLQAAGLPQIGRLTRRPNASAGWWRGATRSCGMARGSKNEVHSILHAHLISKYPHADLFNARGRAWLAAQPLPDDERAAISQHPGADLLPAYVREGVIGKRFGHAALDQIGGRVHLGGVQIFNDRSRFAVGRVTVLLACMALSMCSPRGPWLPAHG